MQSCSITLLLSKPSEFGFCGFKRVWLKTFLARSHECGSLHAKGVKESSDHKYVSLGSSCLNFRPRKNWDIL